MTRLVKSLFDSNAAEAIDVLYGVNLKLDMLVLKNAYALVVTMS